MHTLSKSGFLWQQTLLLWIVVFFLIVEFFHRNFTVQRKGSSMKILPSRKGHNRQWFGSRWTFWFCRILYFRYFGSKGLNATSLESGSFQLKRLKKQFLSWLFSLSLYLCCCYCYLLHCRVGKPSIAVLGQRSVILAARNLIKSTSALVFIWKKR